MNDLDQWLEAAGLNDYREVFADNDVRFSDLLHLTEEDIRELGLPLGARRRLITAISGLSTDPLQGGVPRPEVVRSQPGLPTSGEAQRRQLTVMFADLVGSTELSRRLDPEDLRDLNRAYQDVATTAIERYDGYVARYMGDGILAYFGYPQAHEDDVERAIRAGLDLVESMARIDGPVELAVRVGIATGPVVVGDIIGEGASQESAVVGETPNLASRLQAEAAPNSVLISRATHELTLGLFQTDPRPPLTLKGFPTPQPAWAVAAERVVESRFDARQDGRLTPLVGRQGELALLYDRWKLSAGGDGQVVLLSGEPGIGKSRLCEELRSRIGDSAARVLRYQCSPQHTNTPYYPVVQALGRYAGFTASDSMDERARKLQTLVSDASPAVEDVLPLFLALLGISAGRVARPVDLGQPHQRQKLMDALVSHALVLSSRGPVLVLFEDVHWADPSTLELLGRLIDTAQNASIYLAVTARPEFTSPWDDQDHVTSLALSRLGNSGRREMIRDLLGDHHIPESIFEQVVERTDGIPLFIEELTQSIAEGAKLDGEAGHNSELDIPATLRDSLVARLDRLKDARLLAQVGSVIGRTFSAELLSVASEMSPTALKSGIERLLASQLVYAVVSPHGINYTFKHALIQEAAYLGMLKTERSRLHGRIADILAESEARQSEELARHLEVAGRTEEAAHAWLSAGLQSVGTFANAEAVSQLGHAAELTEKVSASEDIIRCRITALQRLTSAQMALYGLGSDQAKATLERLEAEVRSHQNVEDLFAFLTSRSIHHTSTADADAALRISDEILALSERHLTPVAVAEAHYSRCRDLYYLGRFAESLEAAELAVEVRSSLQQEDESLTPSPVAPRHVVGETFRSRSSWILGMKDTAHGILDRLGESVSATDFHPDSLAWIYNARTRLLQYDGMHRETIDAAHSLLKLGSKYGNELRRSQALILLGWGECGIGEFSDGLRHLGEGVTATAKAAKTHLSEYYALYAESHLAAGNLAEAEGWAEKSMARARELGDNYALPDLLRRYGEVIAVTADDPSVARTAIEEGLMRAEAAHALSWSLRCAISLVHLGHRFDIQGLGRDALQKSYSKSNEGFDKPDFIEAQRLLQR